MARPAGSMNPSGGGLRVRLATAADAAAIATIHDEGIVEQLLGDAARD